MYKEGDVVIVRDDLVPYREYGGITYVSSQEHWRGKEVVIKCVGVTPNGTRYYNIIESDIKWEWKWTDEMFACLINTNDDSLDDYDWSELCLI